MTEPIIVSQERLNSIETKIVELENKKIEFLSGVTFDGACTLQSNQLLTSTGKAVLFPDTGGRLALNSEVEELKATVNTLATRFDKLLTYLENWIEVGNLSMSDIRENV